MSIPVSLSAARGRALRTPPSAFVLFAAGSIAALAAAPPGAGAQDVHPSEYHDIEVHAVAEGLEHPWGLALLPDGRFLVSERNPGHLRLGTAEGELSEPLDGVPEIFRYLGDTPRSQAGLFDVRLHPDFEQNRLVYLSLSKPTERGAAVAVVRGRLDENGPAPRLTDVEDVFLMKEDDQDSSGLHFGGSMVFDTVNQVLFLTTGDRRNISRSQDLGDQAGAILRMTFDGDPAPDNPFLDDPDRDDYLWSIGHRNPQGIALHPTTNELWAHEHGPLGGDEVNRIEGGENYGWPRFTGGLDYSGAPLGYEDPPDDIIPPVHVFEETVAPSGLDFYRGEMFPEWEGDLLLGGLVTETLVRLRIENGEVVEEEHLLEGLERRIRGVRVAQDGSVWIITEHSDGEVIRLTAREGAPVDRDDEEGNPPGR